MSSADTAAARDLARQTKQILTGAGAKLAGKKRGPDRRVRRESYDEDDKRLRRLWRPVNGGGKLAGLRWRDAVMKAAREYDLVGKQQGRWGPLGPHTLRVLAELLELIDFKTGRLDPSYQRLMARTGFARSTIAGALRRLQTHKWLGWMRRTRVHEGEGGPERKQTSNAYFFELSALPRRVYQRFRDLLDRAERRAAGDRVPAATPAIARDPDLVAAIARMQAHFDAGDDSPGAE